MSQLLGCSMEGVAAESVREILTGKVTQLKQDHQRTRQQVQYSEWLFNLGVVSMVSLIGDCTFVSLAEQL